MDKVPGEFIGHLAVSMKITTRFTPNGEPIESKVLLLVAGKEIDTGIRAPNPDTATTLIASRLGGAVV